jgi:hypothetical protein
LVLPFVSEKAIGIDGLFVRGCSSETQQDFATCGKMLQHAIPFPEVGAVALIEDYQTEVVFWILAIFTPGSQMLDGRH